MTHILHLDSSILADNSITRSLTSELVSKLNPSQTTYHDLSQEQLPLLDGFTVGSFFTPAEHQSDEQKAINTVSDTLIAELNAADVLVIGAPMYNFTIPTQLKNYFDLVARAGLTFNYTETGPQGLLTGKKAYVVVSSGGDHRDQTSDFVTPYLRTILGFIGITDVEVITAAGTAMDKNAAVTSAQQSIGELH